MAALICGSVLALPASAGAQLTLDPETGTVRSVQAADGALTRPAAGDRAALALDWARENRADLGLTAADVDGLDLAARSTAPGTGITHVHFRQDDRGIPAFDGGLRVSLDRGGRILNATGSPIPSLEVATAAPRLGALAALRALQRDVGVERPVEVVAGPEGVRRTTRFAGGDVARLVLFGTGRGTRLAWHLTYRADSGAHYDAVVDATSGAVLFRQDLVKDAARAEVFRSHPGLEPEVLIDFEARGWLPAGSDELQGRYAHVYADLDDDQSPGPDEEVGRAGRHFEFTFQDFGGTGCVAAARCSWDPASGGSWEANRSRSGVQAFYLVNHFRDHLAGDGNIAFDGFADADAVRVETHDGAELGHRNNASMATLPEGRAPRMELQLFGGGGFRSVHAADSAAIVWHEYTHGLSSRLVVHDDGSAALSSIQAGAMGEGWSDWYALDLLVNEGSLVDGPAPGQIDFGHYTDRVAHQLRYQAVDCPVGSGAPQCPGTPGAGPGGYTFGDLARVDGGADAHADGEIWAQTLWDLRAAVGSDAAQALITEGMRMSPPEPSFLDMRNAILAAEAGLPGDHRGAIWQVFARRGMGYLAHTDDANDVTPTEDFSLPPSPAAPRGRTTGTVTSLESGLPLASVSVGLGGLFGAAAFPDQLATATAAGGTYALDAPGGTYGELAFERPGYDRAAIPGFHVAPGGTRAQDVALRRDWAARAGNASVGGSDDAGAVLGCGLARLIDQDRQTAWSAWNPARTASPLDGPPTAVVALPQAIDVTGFGLDPTNGCGNDAGAAAKDFRVETSADGVSFATALQGTFGAAQRGRLNEFSAAVRNVRFVRLVLLSPQIAASDYIDFSELEVFGAPPNQLPSGSLAASRVRLTAGGSVSFAAAFADSDSRITGYAWDFDGNGTVDRTTTVSATAFTYARAGTFAAAVAVNDFRGGAGVASRTIIVRRPARPRVALPRRARRGRVTVRVTCAVRCTVVARLRRGGHTVRTVRRTIRSTRSRSIAVKVPRRGRAVRVVVTVRYADGRSTTARRTVRVVR